MAPVYFPLFSCLRSIENKYLSKVFFTDVEFILRYSIKNANEVIGNKMCHAPAICFQVQGRGFIREGYWADLVLIDMDTAYTVSEGNLLYKCGWSPFTGFTFKSSIYATIVSGHIAYRKGQVDPNPSGKQLFFRR